MARKKRKKPSSNASLLPKSALYGKTGTGKQKKASQAQRKGLDSLKTGSSLTSNPDHRKATKAIKQSQKEAKIRELMKSKGVTYAQAAIELME